MSDQAGEKTEKPSFKRLEEAADKGQIARSPEVQTLFVLGGGLMALKLGSERIVDYLLPICRDVFGQLHSIQLNADEIPAQVAQGLVVFSTALMPVILTTAAAGMLAGGIQSRFHLATEALRCDWARLNPVEGLKKIFSKHSLINTGFSILKLGVIGAVCGSTIRDILKAPIFHNAIGTVEISRFLVETSMRLGTLLLLCMLVFAAADYAYQFWHTFKNLMMSKQEVKDEFKNMEGDPQMKARMRRRRHTKSQRQMLAEVPQADVVITNPTHLAVALRYDRKTMRAPRIVAKGTRLNALKIREVAQQHQIPIIENKPVARMMFKHGRVGGEIPAELYAAVAEILAWVYRVNRYRYYSEQNQSTYGNGQSKGGVAVQAE